MSSNPTPVRVPERESEAASNVPSPSWTPEKKSTRFVIKVGGIIPS